MKKSFNKLINFIKELFTETEGEKKRNQKEIEEFIEMEDEEEDYEKNNDNF